MGNIDGKELDLSVFTKMSVGKISKEDLFDKVNLQTLKQADVDKYSESLFEFKYEDNGEWYLVQFYRHDLSKTHVMISVTKFDV